MDFLATVTVPGTRGVPHNVYDLSTGEQINEDEITWSTDSPNLILLNPDGTYRVSGSGAGNLIASWRGYTATARIEVEGPEGSLYLGLVSAVSRNGETVYLELNDNTIAGLGEGATVTWTVSDPSIVRLVVDADGYGVTACPQGIGGVYITCTATLADGSSIYNYCSIIAL